MADFTELVNDFLNIEVNTIIKDGMTAQKMPPYPIAIHAFLTEYIEYIESLRKAHPKQVVYDEKRLVLPEGFENAGDIADLETLEPLKSAIAAIEDVAGKIRDVPAKDLSIANRIRENCAMLERILDPKSKFEIKDRLAIRKMWEVGVEHVVIQTCISLDGDVMTRISTELVEYDIEIRNMLLTIHRESTSVSVQYWKSLLDVIKGVAGGLSDRVRKMLPGGK